MTPETSQSQRMDASPDYLNMIQAHPAPTSQGRPVWEAFRAVGGRFTFLPINVRAVNSQWVDTNAALILATDPTLPDHVASTISQPRLTAYILEKLDLQPGAKVWEVGGGTGYNAALMAELVGKTGHVWTSEVIPDLANYADMTLSARGYDQVTVLPQDGLMGCGQRETLDVVVVTAGIENIIPTVFLDALKPGGQLIIPRRNAHNEFDLLLITKSPNEKKLVTWEVIAHTKYVPLIGNITWGYGLEPKTPTQPF